MRSLALLAHALTSPLRTPARLAVGLWKNLRNETRVNYREVALQARIGRGTLVMDRTRIDEHCDIGAWSYVGYQCFVSRATIGPYASIANNVSIGPGEHALSGISTSSTFAGPELFAELTSKPVTLGADVWIGVDAIIRRGVTIGTGAVIGANSFVSSDVPPFAVVAGSPARLIKYRFAADDRERILASQWWLLDPPQAKQILAGLKSTVGESLAPG
jgi:virginiamycin A acetyltransferase